jgi:hypothetical protein
MPAFRPLSPVSGIWPSSADEWIGVPFTEGEHTEPNRLWGCRGLAKVIVGRLLLGVVFALVRFERLIYLFMGSKTTGG